jgi:hypothetical protein
MLTELLIILNIAILMLLVYIAKRPRIHVARRPRGDGIEDLFGIDSEDSRGVDFARYNTPEEDVAVLFKNLFRESPLIPLRDVILE